jgi:hypothetical protein
MPKVEGGLSDNVVSERKVDALNPVIVSVISTGEEFAHAHRREE